MKAKWENRMALKGNLKDMNLSDIVQMACKSRSQACLVVRSQDREANLFFADGQIVHAALDSQEGEEVIYELLTWEEGAFELEQDVPPPKHTVTTTWSGLILEGLRRIDEGTARPDQPEKRKEMQEMPAKKRSEQLADALSELLAGSSDIEGGALVGIDGLVLSANVPVGKLDETLVGAAAAAIFGLSRRSVEQLKRGDFSQTLIQGSRGNIIVTFVDERNVFVGLTPADINLGMAFVEARQVAEKLAAILKG